MNAEKLREHRRKLKTDGICTICMRVEAREGRVTCLPCQQRSNGHRKLRRRIYALKGKCGECGDGAVIYGRCSKHRSESLERKRKLRFKRREAGDCTKCGVYLPNVDDGNTCGVCREESRADHFIRGLFRHG